MEKLLNSIWVKILRIVLPVSALGLGAIPGSYEKIKQISEDPNAAAHFIEVSTNYYDFSGKGLMDWVPLICMLLCAVAAVAAVVCLRNETENNLTALASALSFALLADLAIVIFMPATVCGWCIAAVLIIDLAITAYQEMKMEDERKK